jgi:response regulator RpfG family c-di-GMP phosphodiesterase
MRHKTNDTRSNLNERILIIDDEENVLRALKNCLRKNFSVTTALASNEALNIIENSEPFSVIVADYRMPGMNGAELLSWIRCHSPETIRIMLTGYADISSAMKAVNEGQIFRFLTKPCPAQDLTKAIEDGLELFQKNMSERKFILEALKATIKVLSEVLAVANPEAFQRTQRVKELAHRVSRFLRPESGLQLELAAALSHMGCITMPRELLVKVENGSDLSAEEYAVFATHPRQGGNLVRRMPRMGRVADIIENQLAPSIESMPEETAILRMLLQYDRMHRENMPIAEISESLKEMHPQFADILLHVSKTETCRPEASFFEKTEACTPPFGQQ